MRGLSAISATSSTRSRRSSGSPPVMRTFVTPRLLKMRTRRSVSSYVRMDCRGSHTYSSSGMQ